MRYDRHMEAYDIEYHSLSEEYEDFDYLIYDDGYIEQKPRWTRQRISWLIVAILVITAMVGLLIFPYITTLISPVPTYMPPPITPPSQL